MTRREFGLAAVGASALAACGWSEATEQPAPEAAQPLVRDDSFHRGVNYTAEWPDRYESERAKQILRSLPEFGVNSIALVPYGMCRKGEPTVRFSGRRSWEKDVAVEELSRVAHDSGMRVLLKPQIWVPRAFPGELDYDDDAERRTWFDSYEAFLKHYATLARKTGADLFCVGVEFTKLIRYEAEWRRLIALVRDLYSGPLVYAANWGAEFESVNFWDALEYIGLNNYYPLPDSLDASEVVGKIEAVHRRFDRPVIFPEAGFPSLQAPHREPWAEDPRAISLEDQARCYEAMFQAYWNKPWFHGVYWWKVGTNDGGGAEDGSHSPWDKPAMDVIARWYLRDGQA